MTITQRRNYNPAGAQDKATGPTMFSPVDVGGLIGWWKADSLSGTPDGGAVSSWADETLSGRTMTQATGANQPIVKQNIRAGKPVVRFDGVNDSLSGPVYAQTAYTIFMVVSLTATQVGYLFNNGNTSTGGGIHWNPPKLVGIHNGWGTIQTTSNISTGQWVRIAFNTQSGNSQLWLNGVQEATSSSISENTPSGSVFFGTHGGAGQFPIMDLAEAMLYINKVSNQSMIDLDKYLAQRWGF